MSFQPAVVQVALLCYADSTDTSNGALRLIPGSHKRSVPVHAALPEVQDDHLVTLGDHHEAIGDQPDQVTFAAKPGDLVVLDCRLLHGTTPMAPIADATA